VRAFSESLGTDKTREKYDKKKKSDLPQTGQGRSCAFWSLVVILDKND